MIIQEIRGGIIIMFWIEKW